VAKVASQDHQLVVVVSLEEVQLEGRAHFLDHKWVGVVNLMGLLVAKVASQDHQLVVVVSLGEAQLEGQARFLGLK
jgi:hypothetical protein